MADGLWGERRTVVDRYFTRYYKTDIKERQGEDQCVLQHSNKICVITVAPSHPLLRCDQITCVNFQVSAKVNRLDNKVSGKGKRGAQQLIPSSPLCEVTCSDGAKYLLYSCVKGKLVEVNEELLSRPQLLLQKPETEGYLAVVLSKLTENIQDGMLTKEEYEELLDKRKLLNGKLKIKAVRRLTGAQTMEPRSYRAGFIHHLLNLPEELEQQEWRTEQCH